MKRAGIIQAPFAWRRRSVFWLGALLITVIVALAAFDIVRTYFAAVEDAGRELDTHARIIAEQTTRTLQAIDVLLRHIAAEHQRGRLARRFDSRQGLGRCVAPAPGCRRRPLIMR